MENTQTESMLFPLEKSWIATNNIPMINRSQCLVFAIKISDFLPHLDRCLALLSTEEQQKLARFKFVNHQNRYAVSHAMLRCILAKQLATTSTAINFTYNPYHKPYCDNQKALYFNISHSDDYVLIAMCQHVEIGVDIESIKPLNAKQLSQRFFHEKEIHYIQADKALMQTRFFEIWTAKEAFIKAIGQGLHLPLDSFAFEAQQDNTLQLTIYPQQYRNNWQLYTLPTIAGYNAQLISPNPVTVLPLQLMPDPDIIAMI